MNDSTAILYALSDIGGAFSFLNKKDSAVTYYTKALGISKKLHDVKSERLLRNRLAIHFINNKDYDRAFNLISPILSKESIPANLSIAAIYFLAKNEPDSALHYTQLLESYNDTFWNHRATYYRIYISEGKNNFNEAFNHLKSYISLMDTINALSNNSETIKVRTIYNYSIKEKEIQRLKEEKDRYTILILLLIAIILSISVILILYFAYKRNRTLRHIMANNLLNYIFPSRSRKDKPSTKLQCSPQIMHQLHYVLNNNKIMTSDDWMAFEQNIINNNSWFIETLISTLGSLPQEKLRMCILTKLGFNGSEIAKLLNKTPGAITLMRKRLYSHIFGEEGSAEKLVEFIRRL